MKEKYLKEKEDSIQHDKNNDNFSEAYENAHIMNQTIPNFQKLVRSNMHEYAPAIYACI